MQGCLGQSLPLVSWDERKVRLASPLLGVTHHDVSQIRDAANLVKPAVARPESVFRREARIRGVFRRGTSFLFGVEAACMVFCGYQLPLTRRARAWILVADPGMPGARM